MILKGDAKGSNCAPCLPLQERQQLSLLETERRAALRQHEDELAAEAQRLDDVAKEQRLRQVESMELAYQTQLQASPATWTVVLLGHVAKIELPL